MHIYSRIFLLFIPDYLFPANSTQMITSSVYSNILSCLGVIHQSYPGFALNHVMKHKKKQTKDSMINSYDLELDILI